MHFKLMKSFTIYMNQIEDFRALLILMKVWSKFFHLHKGAGWKSGLLTNKCNTASWSLKTMHESEMGRIKGHCRRSRDIIMRKRWKRQIGISARTPAGKTDKDQRPMKSSTSKEIHHSIYGYLERKQSPIKTKLSTEKKSMATHVSIFLNNEKQRTSSIKQKKVWA